MPFDAHKNLAVAQAASAPGTAGTSLVVGTGQGARFPAAPFNATVYPSGFTPDPSNAEIVRVTAIAGDTLTITRAQEGTTARNVGVGDVVSAGVTAKTLTDIEANAKDRIALAQKGFVSSTAEQIIARWVVPANTFNTITDSFLVQAGVQCAGAGTFTYRLRVGAAGTTADAQVAILTATAAQAANAYHTVQFQGGFHAANNAIRANGFVVAQAAVLGTVTAAAVTATVNQAAPIHISLTCLTATAQVATVIGPGLYIGGQ